MIKTFLALATSATLVAGIGMQNDARAQVDLDCKLILCIPGAFPTGCQDAYAYMIDRITRTPPLPPIGHCAMSNGESYANYNLDYSWPSRFSPSGYYCRDPYAVFYEEHDDDGRTDITVFCYDPAQVSTRIDRSGDNEDVVTAYGLTEPAVPIYFQLRIVTEPGTPGQYDSGNIIITTTGDAFIDS